jgi:hypothetical protein
MLLVSEVRRIVCKMLTTQVMEHGAESALIPVDLLSLQNHPDKGKRQH